VALVEGLKVNASGFAGPHGERWNGTLVSVQVALSVVVLVAAGLFSRTLWNLHRVDAGFSRQQLLLASIDPSSKGWRGQQIFQFYRELLKRVEALPGVRSASLARIRVLAGGGLSDSLTIRGYQPRPGENMNVLINAVSPKYFGTLSIPFQEGRDFAGTDDPASPGVAIINEMAARRFFPGVDPIGKTIQVGNPVDLRIVGVVQDSKYGDLRDRIESTVYVSALQRPDAAWRSTLYLRVSGSTVSLLASLQSTVSSLAPDLPLFAVRTMDAEVGSLLARERMLAWLSASFGLAALVLAAIGVYGVLAYAISRSTREIGIRMALGAQRRAVLGLVLGRGLKLVGAGTVLGLMGAMASTRLLRSLLFDVGPADPLTFVAVPLLLVFVALLACWLPARRAAKVDPMVALRYE
jgi:predicted permease